MDDKAVQEWRGRLDRQREALADPFPGVWTRVDRRTPFLPAGLAAAAVLLLGLGWGVLGPASSDSGWEPIVDDLWAAPGGPADRPLEAGWEIDTQEWNLFDPGDDQGV